MKMDHQFGAMREEHAMLKADVLGSDNDDDDGDDAGGGCSSFDGGGGGGLSGGSGGPSGGGGGGGGGDGGGGGGGGGGRSHAVQQNKMRKRNELVDEIHVKVPAPDLMTASHSLNPKRLPCLLGRRSFGTSGVQVAHGSSMKTKRNL